MLIREIKTSFISDIVCISIILSDLHDIYRQLPNRIISAKNRVYRSRNVGTVLTDFRIRIIRNICHTPGIIANEDSIRIRVAYGDTSHFSPVNCLKRQKEHFLPRKAGGDCRHFSAELCSVQQCSIRFHDFLLNRQRLFSELQIKKFLTFPDVYYKLLCLTKKYMWQNATFVKYYRMILINQVE